MKNDSENSQNRENESEGNREIHCSEAEWKAILQRGNDEAERFLKLYKTMKIRDGEDRLDKCAVAMGWKLSGDDEADADDFEFDSPIAPPPPVPVVYSLHNTPEATAIFALFKYLNELIVKIAPSLDARNPHAAEKLAETIRVLGNAERDMLLSIDAMDAAEFGLAIILMKQAISALNEHFAAFSSAFLAVPRDTERVRISLRSGKILGKNDVEEIRKTAFDIRDLCLRVIRDASSEIERDSGGNSEE